MLSTKKHEKGIDVPGVRPAEQKRSRILQDRFVTAGCHSLRETRLNDTSIPGLAKAAGSSVGGFYSRFESKEVFFEFMRMQMLDEHMIRYKEELEPSEFEGRDRRYVSEKLVDVMLSIFSGPWRGVLREAYARIPERPDSWEPMKIRGQFVRERALGLYATRVDIKNGLDERVSMAVQLLFSALNNEMMNPNLAFSLTDPQFRFYLISSLDSIVAGHFETSLETREPT